MKIFERVLDQDIHFHDGGAHFLLIHSLHFDNLQKVGICYFLSFLEQIHKTFNFILDIGCEVPEEALVVGFFVLEEEACIFPPTLNIVVVLDEGLAGVLTHLNDILIY